MTTRPLGRCLAAAALAFAAISGAQAAGYTSLNTDDSRIVFAYSQMGVGMEGSFKNLEAKSFSFDTERPETAQVVIEIPLINVDAGYDEANDELEKSEWLDTERHPFARFTSSQVTALGDNRYEVTGQLSIKGRDKEVSVPFEFTEEGDAGVFLGSFTLQRDDFGIGEGQWADFGIVANDIQIKFHFVANP
ncbi:YceI family protein [Pusillimonas sp.]|uniref:YceI family protein n=1 Tax=Pusillimonas sp. TaxID=3040095 RepID=UPI0037CC7D4C